MNLQDLLAEAFRPRPCHHQAQDFRLYLRHRSAIKSVLQVNRTPSTQRIRDPHHNRVWPRPSKAPYPLRLTLSIEIRRPRHIPDRIIIRRPTRPHPTPALLQSQATDSPILLNPRMTGHRLATWGGPPRRSPERSPALSLPWHQPCLRIRHGRHRPVMIHDRRRLPAPQDSLLSTRLQRPVSRRSTREAQPLHRGRM